MLQEVAVCVRSEGGVAASGEMTSAESCAGAICEHACPLITHKTTAHHFDKITLQTKILRLLGIGELFEFEFLFYKTSQRRQEGVRADQLNLRGRAVLFRCWTPVVSSFVYPEASPGAYDQAPAKFYCKRT